MNKTEQAAESNKRVAAIAKLIEDQRGENYLDENGWEMPDEPKRFFCIEYAHGDMIHAFEAASLEEMAAEIDQSETTATGREVYDLDAGTTWIPTAKVTAFIGVGNPPNTEAKIDVLKTEPADAEWKVKPYEATEDEQKYIDYARENMASDELEIDDKPGVSAGDDDGAWVATWVWVTDEQAGVGVECSDCPTVVDRDAPYFATPCGTFCEECMKARHAPGCGICANEFDLDGPEDEDDTQVVIFTASEAR